MKYILFLSELELTSRVECKKNLNQIGCTHIPVWLNEKKDIDKIRKDVEIIIVRAHKVDKSLLDTFPNVKTLSLAFTGYDEANVPYFVSKGINVYSVPDYASTSVAELNIGLVLSILRRIPNSDILMRKGTDERNKLFYPGIELSGKKIGIIGTGKIGIKTAELFLAFNCQVVGYNHNRKKAFLKTGSKYCKTKDELLSQSDIIIMSLPLDKSTKYFLKSNDFKAMKDDAIFINASRSELVKESVLLNALKNKRIWAGLDVTKDPNNLSKKLSKMENVVLTPHIGYKTKEALKRLAETTIANVGRSLRNDKTNRLNEKFKNRIA